MDPLSEVKWAQIPYSVVASAKHDAMALDMARKLYESNSFDSFPEKTPQQFAVDAINRVEIFFEIAQKKGLIDGDISNIFKK